MANTVLTPAHIKFLKQFVERDVLADFRMNRMVMADLYGRGPIGRRQGKSLCWHFYVGHDPRNSVDNVAFMDRLRRREGRISA